MANGPFDPSGMRPNLSRLPAYLKEQLSNPIPAKPGEAHCRVVIFKQTSGLNFPNAREFVSEARAADNISAKPDGALIDLNDFSGRIPLLSLLLPLKALRPVLVGLLRVYFTLCGDTPETVTSLLTEARTAQSQYGVSKTFEDDVNNE